MSFFFPRVFVSTVSAFVGVKKFAKHFIHKANFCVFLWRQLVTIADASFAFTELFCKNCQSSTILDVNLRQEYFSVGDPLWKVVLSIEDPPVFIKSKPQQYEPLGILFVNILQ